MERNEFIEGFGKISSDCNRMTEKHDIHYMIDNTSAAPNVRGRKTLVLSWKNLQSCQKRLQKPTGTKSTILIYFKRWEMF